MSEGTSPYLFRFGQLPTTPPGSLLNANAQNFPIVAGNKGSAAILVLEKDGIRSPHWHPDAWEFDYCISGNARVGIAAPGNTWETFDVGIGDLVFIPQGFFHYIENIGEGQLTFLLTFNTDVITSIGLTESLGVVPTPVLAATLHITPEAAEAIPKIHNQTIIISKTAY